MKIANEWKDYKILDMADGQKLEKWGNVILSRPDPQIIWKNRSFPNKWKEMNAVYNRSKTGGGSWEFKKKVPSQWKVKYKNLTFNIKPMGFKHTGLFPEQAVNWDWMIQKIKSEKRPIKVLNLFAYTGGATVACLSAGASVCHVDSSKGMTTWAKENVTSSKLQDRPVRFIVDDVVKFVNREIRRGNTYDAIIMDPPSYGRGAKGEVWQFENNIYDLIELCTKVLSDNPLFFLINSYTTGISSKVLEDILYLTVGKNRIRRNWTSYGKFSFSFTLWDLWKMGVYLKNNKRNLCKMEKLKIIYEDNHMIVVEKIPNIPSQSDKTGDVDMLTLVKEYIKEKYNKPGNVYVGLIHRLDRPVGGVMVFAKTSKAASRLSNQVREKIFKKEYLAVIDGKIESTKGTLIDYLYKDERNNMSKVVHKDKKNAKEAKLDYEVLVYNPIKNLSLVRINLHTGRHHQIRVQLSHFGHSIFGDQKYGTRGKGKQIALWAYKLTIEHPITKEKLEFRDLPEPIGTWCILKNEKI